MALSYCLVVELLDLMSSDLFDLVSSVLLALAVVTSCSVALTLMPIIMSLPKYHA